MHNYSDRIWIEFDGFFLRTLILVMWKAAVGTNINPLVSSQDDDDDWDTDPNYVNNVTEEEQRWGGGRTVGAIE